ncbi:hypothetical protein L596_016713 [Steinernema carpocapsae]|uniref:Uncharacterized protein n=1 Tax=Steinernema carpocapsae TaxID=34508 RepID=A0A4U5NJV8_STECR|nr:hypothetical protein L596_016713 [Steinernema carpocapsae]
MASLLRFLLIALALVILYPSDTNARFFLDKRPSSRGMNVNGGAVWGFIGDGTQYGSISGSELDDYNGGSSSLRGRYGK